MKERAPLPAPPLDLAATQRLLRELIAAPEGVGPALAERGDAEGRALERLVVGDAALSARARLDVYANAYFFRLLDVLHDDFPGLRRALGDRACHDLATSYLLAAPPRHFSLRHAGDRLPRFLAEHPGAAGLRERFPFAPDLARFERALTDAFDAPDAPVAASDDLAGLPPERFADLPLALAPGARVLCLEHAVQELPREAAEPAPEPGEARPRREPTRLGVWRRELQVRHRPLEELEAEALERVAEGLAFGELCEWLAERLGAEAAAGQAASWLAEWLGTGLLAAFPRRALAAEAPGGAG